MYSRHFPKLDTMACARRCRESGGFSMNPHTGRQPEEGYVVAIDKRHELRSTLHERYCTGELGMRSLIGIYADLYANDIIMHGPNVLIGGWVDGAELVLDLSEVVHDRDVALALARERGQVAVYDLVDKGDVMVEPSPPENPPVQVVNGVEWSADDILRREG